MKWKYSNLNVRKSTSASRKHAYLILTPFNPLLNVYSKTGIYRVCIIFFISAQKHRLWVLVRTASAGRFSRVPQSVFLAEIWKILESLSENFQFMVVTFSIYLNRRAFVMRRIIYGGNETKSKDCWYSLEPLRRGGSMFLAEIWKITECFIWKFSFFGGKIFSIFE